MRLYKKTFRHFLNEIWQPVFGYSVAVLLVLSLLIYRLRDLVPGFSAIEKTAISASSSAVMIMNDPLNAPHKVLQFVVSKFGRNGFIAMRSISVLLAVGLVALFFYIILRWFSFRVAMATTILMASSSWLLFSARLATPEILYLSSIAVIAYGAWIQNYKYPRLSLVLGTLLIVWLLYIPGFIWLVLCGVVWQWQTITTLIKEEKTYFSVMLICLLALIAPLVYAFTQNTALLLTYSGLPAEPLTQIMNIPKNLVMIPSRLILYNRIDPVHGIARTPILDLFTVVFATIGAINFYKNDRLLDRTKILFGGILVSALLVSLGGSVPILILLPFVYLLVANGLAYMIEQWFTVFPTNPFAKVSAVVILVFAITSVSLFHINKYFNAWPQVPTTKKVFNLQPK